MNEKYLQKVDGKTRDTYLALEDKRLVDKLFARHESASASCNLSPDPNFLCELFVELNADRIDFAIEGFGLDFC